MSQISYLIVQSIMTKLTLKCLTEVSSSDPTRAKEVKTYRFQENPLTTNVYLSVLSGNEAQPEHLDGRVNTRDMQDLGIRVPSGEVGGGHLWWRRGQVKVGVYFINEKYEEDETADYAHTVLGRAMHWIERTSVNGLIDDYGEQAHGYPMVYASSFFEGGGPPTSYLWRGNIYWQVLTQRPM